MALQSPPILPDMPSVFISGQTSRSMCTGQVRMNILQDTNDVLISSATAEDDISRDVDLVTSSLQQAKAALQGLGLQGHFALTNVMSGTLSQKVYGQALLMGFF